MAAADRSEGSLECQAGALEPQDSTSRSHKKIIAMDEPTDQISVPLGMTGFTVVDSRTELGERNGIPSLCKVINKDPLALVLYFRVNPSGTQVEWIEKIFDGIATENCRIYFEESCLWISLADLSGLDVKSVEELIDHITATLAATDLGVSRNCLKCEARDELQLFVVGNCSTRLCQNCLRAAVTDYADREAGLNGPSVIATLSLPMVVSMSAAGWAIFWGLIDWGMDRWKIHVIEINEASVVMIPAMLIGVGFLFGHSVGLALRRSAVVRRAPILMSFLATVAIAVAGEIGFFAFLIIRRAGVFAPALAAQMFGKCVQEYSVFWIMCRLTMAAAVCYFCAVESRRKELVSIAV